MLICASVQLEQRLRGSSRAPTRKVGCRLLGIVQTERVGLAALVSLRPKGGSRTAMQCRVPTSGELIF